MAIIRVQPFTAATKTGGTGSTVSNVLATVPVAGNLLVAWLYNADTGGAVTLSSFNDNIGDGGSWTPFSTNPLSFPTSANTQYRGYWKVVGTPSGGNKTVQATVTDTRLLKLFVAEYGVATGTPTWSLDGTPLSGTGLIGTAPTLGNITTTGNDSLLISFSGSDGAPLEAVDNGFSIQATAGDSTSDGVMDRLVGRAGSQLASWTYYNTLNNWAQMSVGFKSGLTNTYDIGLNFRETSGYVTDPADTTYVLGDAYPATRSTVTGGQSVTFGWLESDRTTPKDLTSFARDRSLLYGVRLAGTNAKLDVDTVNFRVDLPASGLWTLRMANGDAAYDNNVCWTLLDSNGTTVLLTQAEVRPPATNWYDAAGVLRTSSENWQGRNAHVNFTSSGSTVYFRMDPTTGGPSVISHMQFVKTASGGGAPTISSVTSTGAVEGGTMTFVVTLSGPVSGSSAVYPIGFGAGTATGSGTDYTSTLTNPMFVVTGGTGSVTISGGNITATVGVSAFEVRIPTAADLINEGNETIILTVNGVSGTGTLVNVPFFTINDVSGANTAGTLTFAVTLSQASASTVTVDYATAPNTATSTVDFKPKSGKLIYYPGDTTKNVSVTLYPNNTHAAETTGTFEVNLYDVTGTGVSLNDAQGIGTINQT